MGLKTYRGIFVAALAVLTVAAWQAPAQADGPLDFLFGKKKEKKEESKPMAEAKVTTITTEYGKTEIRGDEHRHYHEPTGTWSHWHPRFQPHDFAWPPRAAAPAPTPAPAPRPVAPRPAPAPTGPGYYINARDTTRGTERMYGDTHHNSLYMPGTAMHRQVVIEKIVPAEVALGSPYTYELNVFNIGQSPVTDVMVKDELPEGFEMTSSMPSGNQQGNMVSWNVGKLEGGEHKTIKVTGKATKIGTLKSCASVTYTPLICVTTKVVQPALKLVKTMPSEVLLCDDIPITLRVTNTGTGVAKDVKVMENLPAGLVLKSNGQSSVTLAAGDLGSGESRDFNLVAKANKTGSFTNTAKATSGSLSADADAKVTVRQPVLTIEQDCPGKIYLGRNITSCITVQNTGDAAAANAKVVAQLPAGVTFVSATEGGQFSGGQVVWNVGTLAAKGSKKVCVTVKPTQKTSYKISSYVSGECAESKNAECVTQVIGIPAILLEVIDVEDPIEVGDEVTYVITATNQGSAVGNNITMKIELENTSQYVSSSGATTGRHANGVLNFAPLSTLAPKEKATWQVKVKAVAEGDVRFKVSMTSDELTRPVEETEATNFYK